MGIYQTGYYIYKLQRVGRTQCSFGLIFETRESTAMEDRTIGRNGSSRKGSLRFGIGENGKKDHTVVELGSIDTHRLLLSGGEREKKQQPLTNSLSSRQMKSLSALCDTILPSVDHFLHSSDESVNRFYRISASMAGTPELVRLLLILFRLFLKFSSSYLKALISLLSLFYIYIILTLKKMRKETQNGFMA